MTAGTAAWIALLAVALTLFAPLGAAAPVTVPPGSGIRAPGVNYFEYIDWPEVEAETPCNAGQVVRGPDNSVTFTEAQTLTGLGGMRACASFSFDYASPYPSDHLHARFLYRTAMDIPGGGRTPASVATLDASGPGGEVVPVSLLPADLAWPELWIMPTMPTMWVQDPGPGFPLHYAGKPDQTGTLTWTFAEAGPASQPAEAAPWLLDPHTLEARLESADTPPDGTFREDADYVWSPSHVEYAYAELPGMRVERVRAEHEDGRLHDETRFHVPIPAEDLARYGVSIQMDLDPDMAFSYLLLPDGRRFTDLGSLGTLDWRGLRFENVIAQPLIAVNAGVQLTVPATLTALAGPGEYVLVVERPTTVVDKRNDVLLFTFLLLSSGCALTAVVAGGNVRRVQRVAELATSDLVRTGTMRSLRLTFAGLALLLAGALVRIFVFEMPDIMAQPTRPAAWFALFLLVFVLAGFLLVAMRGSDRAVGAMRVEIAEQARAKDSLTRSNRDLEMFASTAAHDLGAPLRSVAGFAQIIQSRHAQGLDAEGKQLLERVNAGAARMQDLLADLLAFSQAHQVVDLREFPLEESLVDALKNLDSEVRATGAKVFSAPLPTVRGSRQGLARVLQNLIGNAIKFRQEGRVPAIEVTAKRSGPLWEISVRDNGIGIRAEDQPRLFQPFFRAAGTAGRPGSGLGLAGSARVIESLGGKIWVESQPGVGTTVRFTVPGSA